MIFILNFHTDLISKLIFSSKEEQFWDAADKGDLSLVKKLAADTTLDVNWQGNSALTAFNQACNEGRVSVVQFLLTLPTVNVNKPQKDGAAPFFKACRQGHKEVVSLLLADTRIDVNKPADEQLTPLWFAAQNGHLPVVQLLLASSRKMDTKAKSKAGTGGWNKTAAENARVNGTRTKTATESKEDYTRKKQNGPLIATLIDSYEQNPRKFAPNSERNWVSWKPGWNLNLE